MNALKTHYFLLPNLFKALTPPIFMFIIAQQESAVNYLCAKNRYKKTGLLRSFNSSYAHILFLRIIMVNVK